MDTLMGNGPLLLLAVAAAGVGFLLMRASPRGTVMVWMVTLFFVPVWIGVTVGFHWAAISCLTVLAIASGPWRLRPNAVDGLVLSLLTLTIGLHGLGVVTRTAAVQLAIEWTLPYIWGRILLTRVSRDFAVKAIAGTATVAAALALIEFFTGTNLFVLTPGAAASEWGRLQPRSDFIRAEGAFGHSIALGGSLAMASAFVLSTRWRTSTKLVALSFVVGANIVTFSRIGLGTVVLVIAGVIVLIPTITRSIRVAVVVAGIGASVLVVPFISAVFLESGDEAEGSANYRLELLALVPRVKVWGSAGDWSGLVSGGDYLGAYARSVDNGFLLTAMRYGWVPLLLIVFILGWVVVTAVRRSTTNPAAIAVAAQIPGFFTVAFITQFGMFFWFLVGLAVAWPRLPGSRSSSSSSLRARLLDAQASDTTLVGLSRASDEPARIPSTNRGDDQHG